MRIPDPLGTTPPPWRSPSITARPRQWAKNLLVFAAPATGRVLLEAGVALRVTATFVAFSLLASGIYFVNDVIDRHEDAAHPRKRSRPVAAGLIAPETAVAIGVGLLVLESGLALWAGGVAPARGRRGLCGTRARVRVGPAADSYCWT